MYVTVILTQPSRCILKYTLSVYELNGILCWICGCHSTPRLIWNAHVQNNEQDNVNTSTNT